MSSPNSLRPYTKRFRRVQKYGGRIPHTSLVEEVLTDLMVKLNGSREYAVNCDVDVRYGELKSCLRELNAVTEECTKNSILRAVFPAAANSNVYLNVCACFEHDQDKVDWMDIKCIDVDSELAPWCRERQPKAD
eukprot:3936873-Rhodomonas_salina.1